MGRRRLNAQERALVAGITEGRRQGLERAVLAQASYVLGREVEDVAEFVAERGVAGSLQAIGEAAQEVWPDRWRQAMGGLLTEVVQSAELPTDRGRLALGFDLTNPRMVEWLDNYTSELAGTLSGTSYENAERVIREAIGEGLSVDSAAARLRERLGELSRSRSELIARTETHRAAIGAADLQARESGVVRARTWRATNDARTRPEHAAMHGETVGLDEAFSNGEMYPSSPNCRCYIEYALDMDAIRGGVA
jgi:SPP1 gp7 family putative phage head morphogenesis protein